MLTIADKSRINIDKTIKIFPDDNFTLIIYRINILRIPFFISPPKEQSSNYLQLLKLA